MTLCTEKDTVIHDTDTTPAIIQPFTKASSVFSSYGTPSSAAAAESNCTSPRKRKYSISMMSGASREKNTPALSRRNMRKLLAVRQANARAHADNLAVFIPRLPSVFCR